MFDYVPVPGMPACFIPFSRLVPASELPERFTFPFYYEPHALCIEAAETVQAYLCSQQEWVHNFGLQEGQEGLVIGKMFGVLLVQAPNGDIGYLAAFSGKLANSNTVGRFVPPVFDMLQDGSFFLSGEQEIHQVTLRIAALENEPEYTRMLRELAEEEEAVAADLNDLKSRLKQNKAGRKAMRHAQQEILSAAEYTVLCEALAKQSVTDSAYLRYYTQKRREKANVLTKAISGYQQQIEVLKEQRKQQSAALQERLFEQYNFINKYGTYKNVRTIFDRDIYENPPSGAGECATPKMLQYAFLHGLKPLAMAEFWWGQSPVSEIRKHKQYYPACKGKCEPILAHMLEGVLMDENPMLVQEDLGDRITTVYEDEYIVVVNKPADFLSVPGINIQDCVLSILQKRYPDATGPLLVHRLDMATSGLLIAGKTKEAHHYIQNQFLKRTIQKRYVALLDGVLEEQEGYIDLPLRVDLDNRPHQLVCYEYGKPSRTKWEVIRIEGNKTRVYFYPITGRTHQLRMHAAHSSGLNMPIVGDDLYGTKANRLHLHAEYLSVKHPATRQLMSFQADPEF